MSRYYEITAYTETGKYYSFSRCSLHTAFYVLRDCINSGLYHEIYFDIYDTKSINKHVGFMPAGDGFIKSTTRANWYFERFKKWVDKYGTSKEISFIY